LSVTGNSPRAAALRSIPAQNEPPAPVSTAIRASGSASKVSMARSNAAAVAMSIALRASGRFNVMTVMGPRRSVNTGGGGGGGSSFFFPAFTLTVPSAAIRTGRPTGSPSSSASITSGCPERTSTREPSGASTLRIAASGSPSRLYGTV